MPKVSGRTRAEELRALAARGELPDPTTTRTRAEELRALAARRRRGDPPSDPDPRTATTPKTLETLFALFTPPPLATVTIDFDGLNYQRVEAPRWAFEAMRDLIGDHIQQADEQFGAEGNKAEWAMVLMVNELRKTGCWTSAIIETLIYWAVWGMHNEDAMRDIGVHDLEIIYRTRPEPNPDPDLDPADCIIINVETRRVVKH